VGLTFERPIWLLALLLCIPVLWTALRWFASMSRARALSAGIARSILITLIAFMLAGASAVQTSDRVAAIAVVDVSGSVRDLADQFADFGRNASGERIRWAEAVRRWIAEASARKPAAELGSASAAARRPDDLFGVVLFDGRSIALSTPSARDYTDLDLEWQLAEGSNIESALRFASALFPPDAGKRLVLISDGNETSGDAASAAREIAATLGARIDVAPISYSVDREVMIEAVDVPPRAAKDSSITVRVVFNSTAPASGTLELLYEKQPLDLNGAAPGTARRVSLPAGRHVELIDVPLGEQVVHRLEPVFTPDAPEMDRIASNNSAEAFTVTPGKGSVLIVDGVSGGEERGAGRTLAGTLGRAGIVVQTVAPEQMPPDLLAMQAFDLIILQNVPADAMSRATQQALADYVVTLGGGLVMTGGYDSFGPGGWNNTPVADVLPVKLELPEQLITPSAAVVIVLDASGSMSQSVLGGSRSQQQIANEGAALAVETLDRTDMVCVIAFNDSAYEVVPMDRNRNPRQSAERIRAIAPGGGTVMAPALQFAADRLAETDASVKHVILLSDGRPSDGESPLAIAEELGMQGIRVSTIAVGDGADRELMAAIAQVSGGKYYEVYDPNTLPRIFIKEIRLVRRPLIKEVRFTPVDLRSGSELTAALAAARAERAALPYLYGYVLTQKRDDPKITYALATPEGEPLLAHWFVGRGQVAVWTSDAHDKWARDWLNWEGYSALWTQIARTIARPRAERAYELVTEIVDDELLIRLDAATDSGQPLDMLTVDGMVYAPDGSARAVRLGQVGPGTYETRLTADQSGNYIVALAPRQGDKALAPVVGGASRALGSEFRRLRSNVSLMRAVAEAGNGRVLDLTRPGAEAALFDRAGIEPTRASLPLWRTLLLWAIAVFLLDVGTRRVAWDRLINRQLAAELRQHARAATIARGERAAATAAALRQAAARVDGAAPPPPLPPSLPRDTQELRRHRPGVSPEEEEESRRAAERARQEEAARIARQRALREQMLRRAAGAPQAPADAAPSPGDRPPSGPRRPTDDSTTGGLLEAKKRARRRMQDPGRDEGPPPSPPSAP